MPVATLAGTSDTLSAGSRESQITDGSAGVGAIGAAPPGVLVEVGVGLGVGVLTREGALVWVGVGVRVAVLVAVGVPAVLGVAQGVVVGDPAAAKRQAVSKNILSRPVVR